MEANTNLDYGFSVINRRVEKIDSMNVFNKTRIYMHYVITQLSLKHRSVIFHANKEDWRVGLGKPCKITNSLAFYHLWEDLKIKTSEEFFSTDNIKVNDCGEEWNKNGFAQRYWIQCSGIYDWYPKFEHEFNTQ